MQPGLGRVCGGRRMEFQGRGAPLSVQGVETACATLAVRDVELWTVIQVETKGCGFLADRRPKILFERHWFHKFTGGKFSAEHPDISNAEAGGYAGGAGEFARLAAAMKLAIAWAWASSPSAKAAIIAPASAYPARAALKPMI